MVRPRTVGMVNMEKGKVPLCPSPEGGISLRYLPRQLDNQSVSPSLPSINLRSFMERTIVYEDMSVSFDRRLREATWMGIALTLIALVTTWLLPAQVAVRGAFLLVLADQLRGYTGYIVHNPWILGIDALLLIAALVLLIQTRNLQRGKVLYHWLAFGQALAGFVNLILLAIPLLFVALNLSLIVVLTVIGMLIGVAVVGGIAYALYQLIKLLIMLVYWFVVIMLLTGSIIAVMFVALMFLRMAIGR